MKFTLKKTLYLLLCLCWSLAGELSAQTSADSLGWFVPRPVPLMQFNDLADLCSIEESRWIDRDLQACLDSLGVELVIVLVEGLPEAVTLPKATLHTAIAWQLGRRTAGRAAIVLFDKSTQEVWMEASSLVSPPLSNERIQYLMGEIFAPACLDYGYFVGIRTFIKYFVLSFDETSTD
ncbi:TPM domain-containing protein [Eisenibacter elegans]|uniref:TPM domain-containing protein n=1 Tax=Eisenibacter elegans TaxID=997 RepID=UPI000479FF49|nr:TPM domain-containing protein [Eisenibacter elegans]